MSPIDGDTIVARATARGIAAIAMIRLSGQHAHSIVQHCFKGGDLTDQPSHTAHVGFITFEGEDIDQVVVTVYKAPGTVTGEDVAEVTCHGGEYVSRRILEAFVRAGARPAQPGEFTQRAFLNGKMDLAQAEAVAEIIHAGSRRAQKVSLSHMMGSYSVLLHDLRDEMLDLCAFIELELDFTEEDVEFADMDRLAKLLHHSDELLSRLVTSYRYGSMLRDGMSVVLGGRPNAGKSTLLNALVGFDRAIVSEIPGTTRDEIREEMEYEGIRIHFLDTAGLRETMDEIEAEGVRRAEASIRKADVLIYVYDGSVGLDEEESRFLEDLDTTHKDLAVLVACNKVDLIEDGRFTEGHFLLSAKEAMQHEELIRPVLDAVAAVAHNSASFVEGSDVVTNERHNYHLKKAHEVVKTAMTSLSSGATGDFLAADLRAAMEEIGAITGATATEDILDRIFSRFCIGK